MSKRNTDFQSHKHRAPRCRQAAPNYTIIDDLDTGKPLPAPCRCFITDDWPKKYSTKHVEKLTSSILGTPAESILTEAARIRSGERNADYGDAVESFEKIARVANEMTGLTLTAADCCRVMMAVKIVRESYNHKRDNLVDLCGYTDILELIEEREVKL